MTKKETIKLLKEHNKWRRGADTEMLHPVKLGQVIDNAIRLLEAKKK